MKQQKTHDTTEEHVKKGFDIDRTEQQEHIKIQEPRNPVEVKA